MSKMFLVCPSINADNLLNHDCVDQKLYVSAPGCVFNDPKLNYYNAIASFLHNFPIKVITLLHKTRCRFSNKVLEQDLEADNFVVEEMRNVYRENYFDIIKAKCRKRREEVLIKKHLQRQMTILKNHPSLFKILRKKGISIRLAILKGDQIEYFHDSEVSDSYHSREDMLKVIH